MNKKLQELLAKRKALLDKIDAILNAVEASTEKRESKEQTEQRQALNNQLKDLDANIEILKNQIAARAAQADLERAHPAEGDPNVRSRPPTGDVNTGLSAQEMRDLQKYSFIRAFNAMLEGRSLDGIEGEMHKHGENEYRNAKVDRNGGNLIIPQLVLRSAGVTGSMERRDLTATGTTTTTGDQGGVLIETQLGSLIDRLRKKLIMTQMGVTMLGGLRGNIEFPKVTGDDQAVEKAENATSAESSATFSKIAMSPRRLPVHAEVSRQLLLQESVDVEAWLRNDLAFQVAQVMNQRAISGSGTGQPYGILNAVGVGAVALGTNGLAPTYDLVVDLETAIAALDADVGRLGYITNTKVRGKMKKTPVVAGQTEMIWDRRNPSSPLNDYPVGITNLVPSNLTKGTSNGVCSALIFGNFADALMGQWGGLEFLINPYSKDTEGLIRINCWTFYDFLVRRVESFAVCKDILTT